MTATRRALTLIELLVVLTILGVLTTLAIVMTDSVVDQARFDGTRKTLDHLQTAVLGDRGASDGPASAGFAADMARLPHAVGADPATQLSELWLAPADATQLYGLRTAPGDVDVKLFAGWRGPYLRLPPLSGAEAKLIDGWGNAFKPLRADLNPAGPGDAIVAAQSAGGPVAPYDAVLTSPSPWALIAGKVNGSVADLDSATPMGTDEPLNKVIVKLHYATPAGVVEAPLVVEPTRANGYSFEFHSVPAGDIALRAWQNGVKMTSVLYVRNPPGGMTIASKSLSFDVK